MAKNAKFEIVYEVAVQGRTTNGFMAKVIDNIIVAFVTALNSSYKQTRVDVTVQNWIGDYDAEKREYIKGVE